MHGARGCRRRGTALRNAAPPLPLVVLPLIASAHLRYARSPSRRDRSGAPCIRRLCALTAPAAPANADGGGGWAQKPARPRRGSAAPPCALACRAARSSRRQARPPAGSRHSIVLSRWRLAPPAALCRRRPARPVVLRAAAVGGACFRRPKGRPLHAPPLPPRPPFFAGGGAHWFALRRV